MDYGASDVDERGMKRAFAHWECAVERFIAGQGLGECDEASVGPRVVFK